MVSLKGLFGSLFDHSYTKSSGNVKLGHWSKVSPTAKFGGNVQLGDWSEVGNNCFVGNGCRFGPWAKIGNDVVLGEGVILGTHTRVADRTIVPAYTTFADNDLVTPLGVQSDMCSGSVMSIDQKTGDIFIAAGTNQFKIPVEVFEGDFEDAEIALEFFMWGLSNPDSTKDLNQYRIVPRSGLELYQHPL